MLKILANITYFLFFMFVFFELCKRIAWELKKYKIRKSKLFAKNNLPTKEQYQKFKENIKKSGEYIEYKDQPQPSWEEQFLKKHGI